MNSHTDLMNQDSLNILSNTTRPKYMPGYYDTQIVETNELKRLSKPFWKGPCDIKIPLTVLEVLGPEGDVFYRDGGQFTTRALRAPMSMGHYRNTFAYFDNESKMWYWKVTMEMKYAPNVIGIGPLLKFTSIGKGTPIYTRNGEIIKVVETFIITEISRKPSEKTSKPSNDDSDFYKNIERNLHSLLDDT